ncbi:MAG: hypothetical protein UR31_C0010G0011 [Parcubacteria group bacterium GW2011_GWA2_33_14]|nr:MAG: hypothetical protein UR31_C0010G0011 [Parcubacteria group bacterium GW2011_GWA2_33_14]
MKKERILHWIKNGAQPSDTVHNLLVSEKIIEAKKINVSKKSKKKVVAGVAAPTTQVPAPTPEAPLQAAETPAVENPAPTKESPKPEA